MQLDFQLKTSTGHHFFAKMKHNIEDLKHKYKKKAVILRGFFGVKPKL